MDISLQSCGIDQNIVGQRQEVICSLSIPLNTDPASVKLGWLNEEHIITDDSRVTIDVSSDYSDDNTPVTVIKFDPLTEKDEGEYVCYAIINGSFISDSIHLQNFTSKKQLLFTNSYVYS